MFSSTFDAVQSDRLRTIAKAWGVRFSALALSAIAKAIKVAAAHDRDDDRPVVLFVPVDLRNRVHPTVEALHMTNFAGAIGFRSIPRFSRSDSIRHIADQYDFQLRQSLMDHDAERGILAMARPDCPDIESPTCVVSILGDLDYPIVFDENRIESIDVCGLAPGRAPIILVTRYAQELTFRFCLDGTLFPSSDMERVVEQFNCLLEQLLSEEVSL
ncbi:phthiocerol/phthiodiolone dimycocerosyl transferase family protein [Pseudonocardia sp. EC080625-04]